MVSLASDSELPKGVVSTGENLPLASKEHRVMLSCADPLDKVLIQALDVHREEDLVLSSRVQRPKTKLSQLGLPTGIYLLLVRQKQRMPRPSSYIDHSLS